MAVKICPPFLFRTVTANGLVKIEISLVLEGRADMPVATRWMTPDHALEVYDALGAVLLAARDVAPGSDAAPILDRVRAVPDRKTEASETDDGRRDE